MDLGAYMLMEDIEGLNDYITKNYGKVPRIRGVRLMKLEKPMEEDDSNAYYFNKYCGKDVIYIHTRCGDCGQGWYSKFSNYVFCGGRDWEQQNLKLFLAHDSDSYDPTYANHYFKAVVDEDYKALVKRIKALYDIR